MTVADKAVEQATLLAGFGLGDPEGGIAVDLGCGPGYQSVALAKLGYDKVIAIDTSRDLLAELELAANDDRIETVLADLRTFRTMLEPGSASAIVCMGDTLTHLETQADVSTLYRDAYDALKPNGRLVLTFRDFSQELAGIDRFIPVRADDQRIMTCVLEYETDSVLVTDLIHVRDGERWDLQKSSYRKLRLSPSTQIAELERTGFTIDHNGAGNRMHTICARK